MKTTGQPNAHKQKSTAYHPRKLLKYNRQVVEQ